MPFRRAKIFLIVSALFLIFFFSNDFGLIDIEKTAIITALAVDYDENSDYKITAQIAVPEVSSVSSENAKTHITGTGKTVGSAIKNVGDMSGWFPNLSFCNLIILGSKLADDNVITVLDYFAKTLRIQDSAVVVLAENFASELIEKATPLDNISSFALQKILLKNPGHDIDTATVDIKNFCMGYYSQNQSSFMPIVKVIENEKSSNDSAESSSSESGIGALGEGSSGSAGSDSGLDGSGKVLFDAKTTALFVKGKKVGELTAEQTFILNALTKNVKATTIEVPDVDMSGKNYNYLLTIERATPKVTLFADMNNLKANVSIDFYLKISDQNTDYSDSAYTKNQPLPLSVKLKATETLENHLDSLMQTLIQTECDFLNLKLKLYRHHHDWYSQYKDVMFSALDYSVCVNVTGQK